MTKTELLKTAKPILFNTDMVRAILDGRKTVTRRVLKVPSKYKNIPSVTARLVNTNGEIVTYAKGQLAPIIIPHPHQIGDVLYVRETWNEYLNNENIEYCYLADTQDITYVDMDDEPIKWKPSIHMPKSAARIFLKVTDVRVERLQDITVEQAIKEGFEGIPCGCSMTGCTDCYDSGWSEPPQIGFMYTWDSTIKKQDLDKYGWDSNPWVWVYEFERVDVAFLLELEREENNERN